MKWPTCSAASGGPFAATSRRSSSMYQRSAAAADALEDGVLGLAIEFALPIGGGRARTPEANDGAGHIIHCQLGPNDMHTKADDPCESVEHWPYRRKRVANRFTGDDFD